MTRSTPSPWSREREPSFTVLTAAAKAAFDVARFPDSWADAHSGEKEVWREGIYAALTALEPYIPKQGDSEDGRKVRWLVDRLKRLRVLSDELESRGTGHNGYINARLAAADLRGIVVNALQHLDNPDTDRGVLARAEAQQPGSGLDDGQVGDGSGHGVGSSGGSSAEMARRSGWAPKARRRIRPTTAI